MSKEPKPDLNQAEMRMAKNFGMTPDEYSAFKTREGAREWERVQRRKSDRAKKARR